MAETLSRLTDAQREIAELKSENATLRSENEWLRSQLSTWDPNYLLKLDLPSADQALAIWKKIVARYPQMRSWSDSERDQAAGMTAAMGFTFTCTKTEAANSTFDGTWWTARAEAWSRSARLSAPRIRSLLVGIIACNDAPFILDNSSIYLDTRGRGQPIDRHAWRALLKGAPLREPMVSRRKVNDASIGHVRVQSAW